MGITSYSVANDAAFKAGIDRAIQVTRDLTVPFQAILKDFYRSEEAIFKLNGPGQYPPFKGSGGYYRYRKSGERVWVNRSSFGEGSMSPYQARKKRIFGFDYPLLVRTGRLADSLTDSSAAEAIADITPLSLRIGTRVPYGIYHQSDEPRSKIPLRKFLFIGPESTFADSDQKGRLTRWLNILNDWTLIKLKEAGLGA